MEKLEIFKTNAINAFQKADKAGKQLLTELFGEKALSQNIVDRVKTFTDVCSILGISETYAIPVGIDVKSVEAYTKLIFIARALNEGWQPNWNDSNEAKWYPWFDMRKGFGFSYAGYDYTNTYAFVGSRLCFKSRELAEYAGKQFESIYKDFLTL